MKKAMYLLLTILLLTIFVSCNGGVAESIIEGTERSVTYKAGDEGTGEPILTKTIDGYHAIMPNSELELSLAQQDTKSFSRALDDGYADYFKKGFSFYGWIDQDGQYYVYNPDEEKNKVRFTKDVTLEALWRDDLTGEVIPDSDFVKITGCKGSGPEVLIIPRVITIWNENGESQEGLVTTIKSVSPEEEKEVESSIKKIVLPDTVTTIEAEAFIYCESLESVVFKSVNPPEGVKDAIPEGVSIWVPEESVGDYEEALPDYSIEVDSEVLKITHAVTFVSNVESVEIPKQVVLDGAKVSKPEDPEKENYVFMGWYKDAGCTEENKWDFEKNTVSYDMVLYAKWEKTQWFDFNNAENIKTTDVSNISFVLAEDAPSTYKESWACPYGVTAYLVDISSQTKTAYSLYFALKAGSDKLLLDDENRMYFGQVFLSDDEAMSMYCDIFVELVNKAELGKTFASYAELSSDSDFWDEHEDTLEEIDSQANNEVTKRSTFFTGTSTIDGLDLLDVSELTDFSFMFYGCSLVEHLDVEDWDISNATNLEGLFCDCDKVQELEVADWDTSNVSNMGSLFCGCETLTELEVDDWNTSGVTKMSFMFDSCSGLVSIDVAEWNTSEVTDMKYMFCDCSGLEEIDVSDWNTSKVTSMEEMFSGCSSLETLEITDWDVSSVKILEYMFGECTALTATESSLNFSSWSTDSLTGICYMFYKCASIEELDLSSFDVSDVDSVGSLFDGCTSLQSININSWNLEKVTYWDHLFKDCTVLDHVYIDNENATLYGLLPNSSSWSYGNGCYSNVPD